MKSTFFIITVVIFTSCSGVNDESPVLPRAYKDISFTNQFRRSTGWIAGDGGYSISINDSMSLWTFGDSFLDCFDTVSGTVPCLFQGRNAAMIINTNDPSRQSTVRNKKGSPSYFEYGTDRRYWFWPASGFTYRDTVYVFLSRLRATGEPGMWGFAGVDSNYIARIHRSDASGIKYSILASRDSINFGISVIKEGRFTLVYGIKSNGFGNDLFVARFRTSDIYGQWQYFDGNGWSGELSRIKKIHSEFTSSFYIAKVKYGYVLITTEFSVGCDQGKNIFSATSSKPYGPFINQHSVWQVDDTLKGHYPFFYVANAHPEFDNGKDELLITYCINGYGDCVETCVNGRFDPDYYRPKAIRVPYTAIF